MFLFHASHTSYHNNGRFDDPMFEGNIMYILGTHYKEKAVTPKVSKTVTILDCTVLTSNGTFINYHFTVRKLNHSNKNFCSF